MYFEVNFIVTIVIIPFQRIISLLNLFDFIFCPVSELSNLLNENSQKGRAGWSKVQDLSEAPRVAHLYQQMNSMTLKYENNESKEEGDFQLEGPLSEFCRYRDRSFSTTPGFVKHERK